MSAQAPEAHVPVPLVKAAVQSAQEGPQHWLVSAAHVSPLVWKPVSQMKAQTIPLHDAVPFATAAQSRLVEQRAPGAHFVAHAPPQSTSDSSPSVIRSVHEAAHLPLVQRPLMQPAAPVQSA